MNALTTFEMIQQWIKPAYSELAKHKLEADKRMGEGPSFDLRLAHRSGSSYQMQMWWTKMGSRVTPEMIWDFADIDLGVSGNELMERLQPLVRDGKVVVTGQVIDNSITPSALFAYHPQRMRNHHPIGKTLAQRGAVGRGFTQDVMETAANFINTGMQPYFAKARLREKLKSKGRQSQDIISIGAFYTDFHHFGKQIFDFPPEMVSLFKRTDVDGIPLDAIKLPHESFYMHFGAQKELATDDGWIPEGAYISRMGPEVQQVIQICLTFAPKEPADYVRFFEHPEPCYVQAMTADKLKIGVGEAVDLVLAEKLRELGQQVENGTPDFEKARSEMAAELEEAGVTLNDATPIHAAHEASRVKSLHSIWQTMLRLVVNGIAYLSAYPDDSETNWPEGAPKDLLETLKTGNYKAKSKATSKLSMLGYSAITFSGRSFRSTSETSPKKEAKEPEDQVLEQYTWVRGHWRRQPYGEGRSLRRLVWLMPHRRSMTGQAAQDQHSEHGHIYQVKGVPQAPTA